MIPGCPSLRLMSGPVRRFFHAISVSRTTIPTLMLAIIGYKRIASMAQTQTLLLSGFDRLAISKALHFANTPTRSARQVFEHFHPLALGWKIAPRDAIGTFDEGWNELRRWLNLICDHRYVMSRVVRKEVEQRVRNIHVELNLHGLQVELGSVEACYSYAVWLLISGDGALARRLIRCEKCGRFQFNNEVGRGRPRRNFCSNEHRNQLSVWKARHPFGARKRRRPKGPWERPWPSRADTKG